MATMPPDEGADGKSTRRSRTNSTDLRMGSVSPSPAPLANNIEAAAQNLASSPLQRRLKSRHIQMIAIGGSIGTGLFVSSGAVLAMGGPASVLIAYLLIGCMIYCTVQALGEMAVAFPIAGSFAHFATRFVDPAWGFAMGWNYALQWLATLPLEIVSASICVTYWDNTTPRAVWATIFWVLIVLINFFGVKGYGETEFFFSMIKVLAVVGFIILGIILDCGGGPRGTYIGGKSWHHPGAFHNGFKGLCSVFVNAAFAFGGTELVGLAAAETEDPRKSLPIAVKQVFWRITLFYVISVTIVGLLVPYTDDRLLAGDSSVDIVASPFVIAIENASIPVLPSIMNAVILVSVLSVGNSSVYATSRALAALGDQGQAPKFLSHIDKHGRPIWSICLASAFGLLGFLTASSDQETIFLWMLAVSGLSIITNWGSICLCHIRFRRAWKVQGHVLDELPFRAQFGVAGSWLGVLLVSLVLVAQFWTGAAPIGYETMTSSELAKSFFSSCLAAPVCIMFYIGFKIYFRTRVVSCEAMDLVTGLSDFNSQESGNEGSNRNEAPSPWKRAYKWIC